MAQVPSVLASRFALVFLICATERALVLAELCNVKRCEREQLVEEFAIG
jgi:hypothetical protein